MKDEARRISKEKTATRLAYDFVPQVHPVLHIDGLELTKQAAAESVDVLIADWMYMPYEGSAQAALPPVEIPSDPKQHLVECIIEARRVLAQRGAMFLFVDHRSDPSESILRALKDNGLRRMDQYIFQKMSAVFSQRDGQAFANSHDIVDVYRRSDVSYFPRMLQYERSVSPKWHCRSHRTSAEPAVHPFEKPVELMKVLISAITVNGLVLDPFAGSGSAGVAAVQLDCSYRGAELVEEYVQIANRRISLAADREAETVEAINAALTGADREQHAAIVLHLERAGIKLEAKEAIQ